MNISYSEGLEHERRLIKYRQEMYDVIADWMRDCNHAPESNCVHQRKAQRVLDRVRGVKP